MAGYPNSQTETGVPTSELLVNSLIAEDRVTAEVFFSALMKICVHLARRHGFKIRAVNCE